MQRRKEEVLLESIHKTDQHLLAKQLHKEKIHKVEQARREKLHPKEQNHKVEAILLDNQLLKETKVKEQFLPLEMIVEESKKDLVITLKHGP